MEVHTVIKHVVCHKYNDKREAEIIAPMLNSLMGKVPGLLSMETGVDITGGARAYHLVLIATFKDRAGLEVYANHPEHVKVKEYIHKVLESSVAVDFEY